MATLGSCRTCKGQVSSEAKSCPHCGQPFPLLNGVDEAQGHFHAGNKIEAIRVLRVKNGLDLKDAKDIVDSWTK
jgi:hypothetical protein